MPDATDTGSEPGRPSGFKRAAKAAIVRYEMPFYVVTALLYAVMIPATIFLFPNVSNLWLSVLILVGGLTATLGAMASAIKADDTTE